MQLAKGLIPPAPSGPGTPTPTPITATLYPSPEQQQQQQQHVLAALQALASTPSPSFGTGEFLIACNVQPKQIAVVIFAVQICCAIKPKQPSKCQAILGKQLDIEIIAVICLLDGFSSPHTWCVYSLPTVLLLAAPRWSGSAHGSPGSSQRNSEDLLQGPLSASPILPHSAGFQASLAAAASTGLLESSASAKSAGLGLSAETASGSPTNMTEPDLTAYPMFSIPPATFAGNSARAVPSEMPPFAPGPLYSAFGSPGIFAQSTGALLFESAGAQCGVADVWK